MNGRRGGTRARGGAIAALVVALYLALGAGYLLSVPLFEGPDEPSHVLYAGYLAEHGRPPAYGPSPEVPGEGMQPPLSYAPVAALFGRVAGEDAAAIRAELRRASLTIYGYDRRAILENRLLRARPGGPRDGDARSFAVDPKLAPLVHLRWPSLAFGLATVLLTLAAARRATGDPDVAALAAALVALNPQFLFSSGLVTNDTAATAVGGLAFCAVAGALRGPSGPRHYLLLAGVGALGFAVKLSTLPGVALAAVAVALVDTRPVATRARDAGAAALLAALASLPLLLFNRAHRGGLLGTRALWDSAAHLPGPDLHGGLWSYLTGMYWSWTLESYVARFGWMNLPAPGWVHAFYALVAVAGVGGFVLVWTASRRPDGEAPLASLTTYLAAAVLVNLAAHVWLNLHTAQPQGRHLFPSAPQLATLLALGLRRAAAGSRPLGARAAAALVAPLAVVAAYCLVGVLRVRYP